MITAEEILSKYSKAYGPIEGNPRAIVRAPEALEAMLEFAKEAIKADRLNLLNHAEVNYYVNDDGDNVFIVDQKTIISAPNIELL